MVTSAQIQSIAGTTRAAGKHRGDWVRWHHWKRHTAVANLLRGMTGTTTGQRGCRNGTARHVMHSMGTKLAGADSWHRAGGARDHGRIGEWTRGSAAPWYRQYPQPVCAVGFAPTSAAACWHRRPVQVRRRGGVVRSGTGEAQRANPRTGQRVSKRCALYSMWGAHRRRVRYAIRPPRQRTTHGQSARVLESTGVGAKFPGHRTRRGTVTGHRHP